MSQPSTRAGRTLAARPKSTCQTSPRFTFGMLGFPPVKRPRALGGDGHHLVVVQTVGNLRLHPACELDFFAFWQPRDGFFDFSNRAHAGNLNQPALNFKHSEISPPE